MIFLFVLFSLLLDVATFNIHGTIYVMHFYANQ
jgi:hypothetical protein